MGYHASGDTRKIMQSSEDDEGYENQSYTRISVQLLNQQDKHFTFGTSQNISPVPISSTLDDTDRSFWAEDELSSSEFSNSSKQQLNKKQKRRHSLSYRNRIAVHRSRSLLFQSSSSSLNSMSDQISKVPKEDRFTKRFNVEEKPGYSNVKKQYTRKKVSSSLINDRNIYKRYKYLNKKNIRKRNQFLVNKAFHP